jgi:hypothetical protein
MVQKILEGATNKQRSTVVTCAAHPNVGRKRLLHAEELEDVRSRGKHVRARGWEHAHGREGSENKERPNGHHRCEKP